MALSTARRSADWLLALLLLCVALVPRTATLADFGTIDETYHWIIRVRAFDTALQTQSWADTDQTGHPGVTTMWLGTLGRHLALDLGVPPDESDEGQTLAYLALLRLGPAAVNALAVALGYVLLRRRLERAPALLAGALWALDPFLIAHSRLLHVDALATSFMTLSVLALVTGESSKFKVQSSKSDLRSRFSTFNFHLSTLVLSGIFGGLALLSKVSSLALLPFVGLWLLAQTPPGGALRRFGAALGQSLLWGAALLVTVVALWPAMWVAPLAAIQDVLSEAIVNGGSPHDAGNFFLGQALEDPGPFFYPVALLWRSAPLTIPALALLAWHYRHLADRRLVNGLLGFALTFGVVLSIGAKKFDRYLLPIWPSLLILAAIGIWAALRNLPRWRSLAVGGGVAITALTTAWFHPYTLAYFNPLLGGAATGQRVLVVGWGEGMDAAGAWLAQRPDLVRGPVLSWIPPTLQPSLPSGTLAYDIRPTTLDPQRSPSPSYAVLYIRGVQRRDTPDLEAQIRRTPPLHTVTIHGIPYATIHQLPRPFTTPADAQFGAVRLRGYTLQQQPSRLYLTLSWDVRQDDPGGANVFAHLIAPDGQRVAQLDLPLDEGMFASWQAGQQFGPTLPLQLPAGLAPGEYRLVLGVYRQSDGARLPLSAPNQAPETLDGPNALLLTTVNIR